MKVKNLLLSSSFHLQLFSALNSPPLFFPSEAHDEIPRSVANFQRREEGRETVPLPPFNFSDARVERWGCRFPGEDPISTPAV